MSRIQRIALAASTVVLGAAMTAGCGALHDAPVSNATANKNPAAAKEASVYRDAERQAPASAGPESGARRETGKKGAPKAKAPEKKAAGTEKTKAAPAGGGMAPAGQASDIPAWVTAINWAQGKLGHKYVWGGDGYDNPYDGFDCSGLMKAAYKEAGITLPRVAQDQYSATNVHPKESELRPGDLVFFGTRRNLHHVGMYVGRDGKGQAMMLHAPNSRTVIKFSPVQYMDDYYGATRVSP